MAAMTAGLVLGLGGCVSMPRVTPFDAGPVNPDSSLAAEIHAAALAPGSYPTFASIPPPPKDVRPISAWRSAVLEELEIKRSTEWDAAAVPFTLAGTEAWANAQHALIPPRELEPVAPGEAGDSEAFAAAQRARATPPPAPH